jgi:hypothetical protein
MLPATADQSIAGHDHARLDPDFFQFQSVRF